MSGKYDYLPDDEFYESDEWIELKEEILERDEYMCRMSGETEDLSVHHIIPRKYKHLVNFDIDSPRNLITLSWKLHSMADHKMDNFGRRLET